MADNFIPDPVQQMQKVDVSQFKNLDELLNGILDAIGNKMQALGVAAAGGAINAAANFSAGAMSTAINPMDPNSIKPSASPEVAKGAQIEAPGRGRGITTDSAPSMGSEPLAQSKSPSSLAANVDMRDVGTFTPTAVGGKMREESQGVGFA